MRWRLPLGVVVACLFTTGVVGAVTNQSAEPVQLDASAMKPKASLSDDAQDVAAAETTTTQAEAATTTTAPPSTTTTRPPAPKPALAIGSEGLYSIDLGAWSAKLTTTGAVSFPSFSRDGTRVAYGRGTWGGGDSQLYVSNADGGAEKRLTGIGYPWYPTFSPSGTFIGARGMVDPHDGDGEHERGIVRVDTDEKTELPGGEGAAGRWHPTQDRYLYAGGAVTHVYDASAGTSSTIALSSDGPVAWSPDGTRIAVCAASVIATAGIDGLDKKQLANIGSCGECKQCSAALDWSSTGILVRNEAGDAIRIDPSSGAKAVLAQNTTAAAWSPDGRDVAIATFDGDNPVVVLAHPDGTNRRVIVRGPGLSKWGNRTKFDGLAWSPDGKRLLVATAPPPE